MKKEFVLAIICFFLFIFAADSIFSYIELTEIMYNPNESNEWVEFYYGENVSGSIEGLKIRDNLQEDEILCCQGYNCSYVISPDSLFVVSENHIALELLNLSENMQYFCVDDSSIGNGLGNERDQIILSDENMTYVNFSYNQSIKKGYSLALINDTWLESMPTPLFDYPQLPWQTINWTINESINASINQSINISINQTINISANQTSENNSEANITNITDETNTDLELSFIFDETIYSKINYHLFKLTNLNYLDNGTSINATLYFNITKIDTNETCNENHSCFQEQFVNASLKKYTISNAGDFYFEKPGNYFVCGVIVSFFGNDTNLENNQICREIEIKDLSEIPCNITLSISTEKEIFQNEEQVEYTIKLSNKSFPVEITYWIEDLFSNIEKEEMITENDGKKTYTPKDINEEKSLLIKARLSKTYCNNSNTKISSEKLIAIKGNTTRKNETTIEIIKVTPQQINFGGAIEAQLKIYKGESTKTALSAYVWDGSEKISQTTNFNLYGQFSESEISIPILLFPNCEKEKADGRYILKISGLNTSSEANISISGIKETLCPKQNTEGTTTKNSGGASGVPIFQEPSKKQYNLLYYGYDDTSNILLVKIDMTNTDKAVHTYDVWAYIYEGRNSLSGDRESNKQSLSLESGETKEAALKIQPEGKITNETSMKIRILRDDRKTPYEITQSIGLNITYNLKYENLSKAEEIAEEIKEKSKTSVSYEKQAPAKNKDLEEKDTESLQTDNNGTEEVKEEQNQLTGRLIYESKATNLKSYSIYFVVFLAVLMGGYFAFRKIKRTKKL